MSGNTRICEYLKDKCPQCSRYFRRDERYIDCPDCGASRKCGSYAVKGQKYCVKHGGKANLKAKYEPIKGSAIVTGKNSKSIIANLASKYVEMGKSGPLVSNRKTLSILDARITELLDRIEEGYSVQRIKTIVSAWETLKESVPGLRMWVKESKKASGAYNTLDSEVDKAFHDYESWQQIGEFFNLRSKISKDEMSILKDMRALITAEDAYDLVAQLLAATITVLGDVPDGPKYIQSIHREFARILGEPSLEQASRGEQEIIDITPVRVDTTELLHPRDDE